MRADLEDFKTGWFGLMLGLSPSEIDEVIARLTYLKAHPDEHFHWRSNYTAESGVADIGVYVAGADTSPNLVLDSS
jgi:hypothetical protein